MDSSPFIGGLPIGIVDGERWIRDYVLRELTGADLKILQNRSINRNSPVSYIAKAISMSLESLGGTPVYKSFASSNYETVPDIVLKLPNQDASYLMIAAHVYNYGSKIDNIEARCSNCRSTIVFGTDLNSVDVTRAEHPINTFTVKLEKGFSREGTEELVGIDGVVWDIYEFRVPTLGDMVRQERYYISDKSNFDDRVLFNCLVSVRSSEDDREMPESIRNIVKLDLFDKIKARDKHLIEKALSRLPTIDDRAEVTCHRCEATMLINPRINYLMEPS